MNIIDEIRTAIGDSGMTVEVVARKAGLAPGTLYYWLEGKTTRPWVTNVEAVANALGKRLTMADGELHLGTMFPPPQVRARRHAAWGWRRWQ